MHRYYLVPEIGDGSPINEFQINAKRPKYFGDMTEISWVSMPFGLEPTRLVGADLSAFDHNLVAANADVTALPANLDQNPGAAAVTTIQNALEAHKIPAGWVTTAMTYREILRKVCQICQFMQRLKGIGLGRLFAGAVTLSATFGSLPVGTRQKLRDATDSFGWDRTGMTNATTLRAILKAMADQWSGPILLGNGPI